MRDVNRASIIVRAYEAANTMRPMAVFVSKPKPSTGVLTSPRHELTLARPSARAAVRQIQITIY